MLYEHLLYHKDIIETHVICIMSHLTTDTITFKTYINYFVDAMYILPYLYLFVHLFRILSINMSKMNVTHLGTNGSH